MGKFWETLAFGPILGNKKTRDELFGREKYEPQEIDWSDIPYPTMPSRTAEEEAVYQPAMRLTAERLTSPVSKVGALGQAIQQQLEKQYRETAAPSYYARGMGGQAGQAGLGAAMAEYAPKAYLQGWQTEQDEMAKRLSQAFQQALPYGQREREYKFEESKYPYATALDRKQYEIGLEAGKAARIAAKNKATQDAWKLAAMLGTAMITGGATAGAGAGAGGNTIMAGGGGGMSSVGFA